MYILKTQSYMYNFCAILRNEYLCQICICAIIQVSHERFATLYLDFDYIVLYHLKTVVCTAKIR